MVLLTLLTGDVFATTSDESTSASDTSTRPSSPMDLHPYDCQLQSNTAQNNWAYAQIFNVALASKPKQKNESKHCTNDCPSQCTMYKIKLAFDFST